MIEWAPRSKNIMTFDEAVLYCQFLDYGGHKDWRLPTKPEYNSAEHIEGVWYATDTPHTFKWYAWPVREI
jgi:hypothetical protein